MSEPRLHERATPSERCAYCHGEFAADSMVRVRCARCHTPHHAQCFREHGVCSSLGCASKSSDQPASTLPPPRRPVLESAEHTWTAVLSAGLVLMAAGAFGSAAPPPSYGAVIAGLGVALLGIERIAGRRDEDRESAH